MSNRLYESEIEQIALQKTRNNQQECPEQYSQNITGDVCPVNRFHLQM
jgi:hypothetical protein